MVWSKQPTSEPKPLPRYSHSQVTCDVFVHSLTTNVNSAFYSPNSITPTFTETSLRGKSWTQIMKVADTNHLDMLRCLRQSPWQVRDKPVCVALMEFSLLQCTGKVSDNVCDKVRNKFTTKLRTQIMKVDDVICVADFRDLCLRLCREFIPDFVAKSA